MIPTLHFTTGSTRQNSDPTLGFRVLTDLSLTIVLLPFVAPTTNWTHVVVLFFPLSWIGNLFRVWLFQSSCNNEGFDSRSRTECDYDFCPLFSLSLLLSSDDNHYLMPSSNENNHPYQDSRLTWMIISDIFSDKDTPLIQCRPNQFPFKFLKKYWNCSDIYIIFPALYTSFMT